MKFGIRAALKATLLPKSTVRNLSVTEKILNLILLILYWKITPSNIVLFRILIFNFSLFYITSIDVPWLSDL